MDEIQNKYENFEDNTIEEVKVNYENFQEYYNDNIVREKEKKTFRKKFTRK